jgi:hypothetical protein
VIRIVGVVVPAANEQNHIGACLQALADSRKQLALTRYSGVDVRVVVVLDSCVDDTMPVVAGYAGVEAILCSAGSVGVARATGARHLINSASVALSELWLANTDADSRVPRNWLSTLIAEAERGTHVVLGTVLPDVSRYSAVGRRWYARHVLRDGHPHIHGANLGIRADTYEALGGWPPVGSGEDVALAERVDAAGHLRVARIASIPVTTSARSEGRAPRGFADYLRSIDRPRGGEG